MKSTTEMVTKNGDRRLKQNGHASNGKAGKALLEWHRLHAGVYARVARNLGVDASYVSRVANGERQSSKIEHMLITELRRIQRLQP